MIFTEISCRRLSFACLLAAAGCGSMLRGVTISGTSTGEAAKSEKAAFIKEIRKRPVPLVFSNSVPDAESREIINTGGSIIHLVPAVFGGLLGTRGFDIEGDAQQKIAEMQPLKAGNIFIIDNIKTDLSSGFGSEFWNNYLGALLVTYEGYSVVYEIAEINPEELYNYIHGMRKEEVSEKSSEVLPYAVFRGVVHSVSGKMIDISSPQTSHAHSGQTIVILNRSGKVVGKARVSTTFHTKVKATIISGTAEKGFSAEIYK